MTPTKIRQPTPNAPMADPNPPVVHERSLGAPFCFQSLQPA
jgi:hypothetical protein